MMNLDEAIKHCIKIAEKYEEECKNWAYGASQINDDENRKKQYQKHAEMWQECANEHRQLAKWLKELEAYIKIISELSEALHFYDGCEKCQGFREYPTSDFVDDVRSWVKQFEEVNTDES